MYWVSKSIFLLLHFTRNNPQLSLHSYIWNAEERTVIWFRTSRIACHWNKSFNWYDETMAFIWTFFTETAIATGMHGYICGEEVSERELSCKLFALCQGWNNQHPFTYGSNISILTQCVFCKVKICKVEWGISWRKIRMRILNESQILPYLTFSNRNLTIWKDL